MPVERTWRASLPTCSCAGSRPLPTSRYRSRKRFYAWLADEEQIADLMVRLKPPAIQGSNPFQRSTRTPSGGYLPAVLARTSSPAAT
jgi:hypothetical protein